MDAAASGVCVHFDVQEKRRPPRWRAGVAQLAGSGVFNTPSGGGFAILILILICAELFPLPWVEASIMEPRSAESAAALPRVALCRLPGGSPSWDSQELGLR